MFHLAWVNNPQDALVIWTFASVLYHGKWKEGVQFVREHAKVEVKFVPEILGFLETKSDEDLAKDVAQFASLVQDSVWALTETHSLFESMSRYPFSPCSGLVFVLKKTAKDTAKIFDLMLEDIRSFINERWRESPEINYHLLGKGEPSKTRYVLGKIILETMKAGSLGCATMIAIGENVVPQAKAIEEIQAKNQLSLKKNKKRATISLNPEAKQGIPKKQKLVDDRNNNPSELYAAIKKQEVAAKQEFQDSAKKHQKLVKTCKISKGETNSMQGNKLEKGKSRLLNQERTVVKQESGKNNKKKKAKKHTRVIEKLKHHISAHAVSKRQHVVVSKCNLRQDEMVKWEAMLQKEVVKETSKKRKTIAVE